MAEEPFFLVNEFLGKEKNELEHILNIVHGKNQRSLERAAFLRNFTNELFRAYKKTIKTKVEEKKEPEKKQIEKKLLLEKKQELLKKIEKLKQKTEQIKVPEPTKEKELILSKETGKPLVTTEFKDSKYYVREPILTEQDKNILKELKTTNIDNKQRLIDKLKEFCTKFNIEYSDAHYDKIRYYLVRDLKRYGKISPLLEDKDVKEIVCEGANKPIIISYQNKEDILTDVIFTSDEELNNFVLSLAKKANQKVSVENPFLNTNIENMNLQATLGSEFVKPKFIISKI